MADFEAGDIPRVGVAIAEFIEGAAAPAKSLGIKPALLFISHPVWDRTDVELKKLADVHLEPIPAMAVALTGRPPRERGKARVGAVDLDHSPARNNGAVLANDEQDDMGR